MAIVPLKKVTLYGSLRDRDLVLAGLQRMGCLHLLDMEGSGTERDLDQSERNQVAAAIRFLTACPIQNPQQRTHYLDGQSCVEVAGEILRHKERTETLSDQEEDLQRQIELLEPWGEFHPPLAWEIGGQRLWFYAVPHHEVETLESSVAVSQRIQQDRQAVYVVVVQAEAPVLPWPDLELPPRPLSELQQTLEVVREELERLHWQRVEQTHWLNLLRRDLAQADDGLERLAAAHRTLAAERVFALQAWTP